MRLSTGVRLGLKALGEQERDGYVIDRVVEAAFGVFDQFSRSVSVMGGSTVTIKRVFGGKSNGSSSRIVLSS